MDILNTFEQFQKQTEVNNNFNLQYMSIGLGGEVGEILNEIKKLERDDNGILTNNRREKILLEMGDVLWYLQGIASRLNSNIESILKLNIEKINNKINNKNDS